MSSSSHIICCLTVDFIVLWIFGWRPLIETFGWFRTNAYTKLFTNTVKFFWQFHQKFGASLLQPIFRACIHWSCGATATSVEKVAKHNSKYWWHLGSSKIPVKRRPNFLTVQCHHSKMHNSLYSRIINPTDIYSFFKSSKCRKTTLQTRLPQNSNTTLYLILFLKNDPF